MDKIALVLHATDLGGAQRVASELSLEFAKENDVTVITFEDGEQIYPFGGKYLPLNFNFYKGAPGFAYKLLNIARLALILRRIFKEQKFDKIYSFMEGANYPAILADKRTIGSIHCNPDKCFAARDWLFSRLVYPRARKIICVSDAITELVSNKLHLKNAVTVYNPTNFQRIQQAIQEPVDFHEDYIVAVGRLVKEKNFELLVDAFALSKTKDHCRLLILGEGDKRQAIEERIKANNLEGRVVLLGFKKNPFKYLAQARFLVSSSDTEALPMSLIESLSLNVPVVSTDCPTGPREIIDPLQNGLLTPVGDAKALGEAIDKLYFDKELYETLKSNAKPSVEHLSINKIATEMLELYH